MSKLTIRFAGVSSAVSLLSNESSWEGLTIRWSYRPLERLMELLKLVSELLVLVHSGQLMIPNGVSEADKADRN